jgi:hypothetical protein
MAPFSCIGFGRNLRTAFALIVFGTCCAAFGQGFKSADGPLSEEEKQTIAGDQAHIGESVWVYFGSVDRFGCPSIKLSPNDRDTRVYTTDKPVRVTIVDSVGSKGSRYFQLKVGDGDVGFIPTYLRSRYFDLRNDDQSAIKDSCVLSLSPDELRARKPVEVDQYDERMADKRREFAERMAARKREAEAALADMKASQEKIIADADAAREALAKKPNAKIGMTAKQVVEKTNWGEPISVNKTVTARGVLEQWVYGDGYYLYFENGKLRTIQTKD